ncbi:putative polyketide synthase [Aspergillus steynii IBT 23096]|uniref:Putative polyketide synthase n=1 Tax=Aspergillus steynii IBT 23096 TaxID=1392250 RepID=A0A2I2FWV0_9EURO|nr:putative polyketide synthase [Aspergillus steynii IBT 23096]PLB45036.1 putative polyketide synthase [Aspergillus steynii IBT 23096]
MGIGGGVNGLTPANGVNGVNGTADINGANGIHGTTSDINGHYESNTTKNPPSHADSPSEQLKPVPIAVCGMGMRLPGGIRNDKDLYNFLINKGDARSVIGQDRFNVDAYYSPHGKHGTISTKHGYLINDVDFSKFDLSMFSFTPAEIEQVDPNHRLVLEVVREAFESAGEKNWRGKNIGTYVGMFSEDWQDLQHKDTHEYNPYRVLGGLDFALPNRVSYEYDLKGPSMILKSACSSAGLSLHQALQAIRQGEITSAIVCGSNLILAPGMTISMSLQMALSPEGSSKTFDASADGYARGEGVTALYIKRLDEAIKDGNPIRAVIRGSASNADGKTNGLALPNPEAHDAVIRQAYKAAGLGLSDTAIVEAHGTGTKIGDPIEATAIGKCFEQGVYIGAIKPNLGHSEGAAALTSIMKAVLSLEHRTIIPNIKFHNPNPAIPWETAKLTVPVEPTSWPTDRAERISVNSYGIGGSNAHFIIDSAASYGVETSGSQAPAGAGKPQKNLLLFSANHTEALNEIAGNMQGYLEEHPENVSHMAYTLAERREHLKLRSFGVVDGSSNPFDFSAPFKFQGPREVAFVFTGQGAQWVNMGKELMLDYPSFLEDIRLMDRTLKELEHSPSWSIEDVLLNCDDRTVIGRAEYAQPLCTAVQLALVNHLKTWGIVPSAVVGHSSGEIAAAYAAGVLLLKEAIIAAYYRGYVCRSPQRLGGMAAVGLSKNDATKYLEPGVKVACENSGSSVTLSGDLQDLETVLSKIKDNSPETFARKLQVEMAYHSHHMTLVGDVYRELIAKHLSPRSPNIPFYSSVRAKPLYQALDFGPEYWQENLESPVLFHSAVRTLLSGSKECSVHLEVGPHSALAGPLRQIYSESSSSINYVSALSRGKNDSVSFLEAVGQLHCHGVQISYPFSETAHVLTDLPTYPWHYDKSYWGETRIMKNWRFRKHLPHDLLGLRVLEASEISPTWRNELRLMDAPWLRDHCVGNDIVFPGAGYIAMAGEAIFQVNDIRDYTVKDVELSKALVLYNDKPVEIMTTLRPQRLTSTLDSDWYEFQIVSFDGSAWNKHCSGLVRSGRASPCPRKNTQSLDRQVSSTRWYTTMSRVGLNYGPRFTGLENLAASVVDKVAEAHISDKQEPAESPYMLHPATLDLVFQSLTVATCQGIYRTFKSLFLPTFIEELYIGDATGKNIVVSTAAGGKPGTVEGTSYGMVDNDMVFYLKGFRGKAMEDSGAEQPAELKSLQLQWKPHFDFLKAGDLMKLKFNIRDQIQDLERLYVLCAIEARNALADRQTSHPHMEKYRAWLDEQHEKFQQPEYPLVTDSFDLTQMNKAERRGLIPEVFDRCLASGGWAPATAIKRAFEEVVNVYEGRTDYLDLLLQDGVLTGIYSWYNDIWDFADFMQLLGHAKPQLRILEIGAGTGGLTAKFLEQLRSDFDERLYLKYTYTDISSGFFVQAKERFKDYDGIEYKALDISRDPLEQGFNAGEYDLIIASNVLHATPFLQDTLTNVRTLLQPKGQLFLQELCPITRAMSFIMGQFPGWWLSEEDGRIGSPFISPDEWDKRLRLAGFDGCDSVTLDNEQPYTYNSNIIAKPAVKHEYSQRVTLLHPSEPTAFSSEVEALLQKQGVEVDHCKWGDALPADQDLISFVDLGDRPLLQDISEDDLSHFLRLVDSLQISTVLWLSHSAQIGPKDPHAAQILGMARTIRSELAMSFSTLELEDLKPGSAQAVVNVIETLQDSRDDIGELDTDMEWAWSNGQLHTGRFHWVPVEKALCETAEAPKTKGLSIGTPGLLQTLHWASQPLGELSPDEASIRMSAVGLNFKDVMIAMGVIPGGDTIKDGSSPLGLEGTGYVTNIGSEVSNIAVGDRVMLIGCESVGMATVINRPACLCVKIPDQLSDDEAATMPVVYITVLMFLVEKWKLEKGQSILIHSAAGVGVGICAINVAQWIGAEIYATVGSEEKAAFLTEEFGIPEERIFNSRDSSFLDGVMNATHGVGVDLVLNSLSGELLHTSWKCVAPYGAMAEIGKRDMVGRGKLALDPFEDNRAFIGGDIARLLVTHKSTVARLLQLMVEQYQKGLFKPIKPITTFNAENAEDAFRFMQKGTHIGKVVIKFPQEDTLPLTATVPAPRFRSDASYLLVGGLGGLGKAIASWMALHGAGNLMFLSRSAGKSEEDRLFLKELNMMGCSTQCFACDIADPSAVKNAIGQASLPIAGAMQMAMVLRDVGILGMDIDSWRTAVAPKVQGTWNLHDHLPKDMDFFVLFSSIGGTFGYYGQSNYASANTFLDSFVQYRQAMGLAASVMDIGPVDDVGYVSRTPATRETLIATLETLLTEQNFLDSLQLAIARSSTRYAPADTRSALAGFQNPSHIVQALESRIPIMDPQNGSMWKREPRMAIYRNIQKTSEAERSDAADQLKHFLASMMSDPAKLEQEASADVIATELAHCVASFLMREEDEIPVSATLSDVGVDSLVAIEVRNWWRQNLSIDVSVLELMNGGSIENLGGLAAKRLQQKYSSK